MTRSHTALLALICCLACPAIQADAEFWPCWRGPCGDGACIEQNIPTNWDPAGAAWKTEIPGQGHASAIVWGDRVTSFDPDTGEELWTVDGPSQEFCATPVHSEKAGLVFISSSWPKQVLLAIRPDGSGNVTQTHIAWQDTKGAPYVPSMTVAGDHLLTVNNGGVAFCYEAATGKVFWQEKIGKHHASPVLIGGLVYLINDDGQVNVIKPGPQFERVASYELGESCYASPAISDGQVFLRGFQHMFCFGRQP